MNKQLSMKKQPTSMKKQPSKKKQPTSMKKQPRIMLWYKNTLSNKVRVTLHPRKYAKCGSHAVQSESYTVH